MDDRNIMIAALEAGFMISTQYGQGTNKLMPCSDMDTLREFVRLLEEEK